MPTRSLSSRSAAIALAALLALSACTNTATAPAPAESVARPAPSTPPTKANPAPDARECPDADFALFLQRFENSVDVQRASTADPLTMERIDADAEPEPARVSRQVPLAQAPFPVMRTAMQRTAEGLQETIEEHGPNEREVKHAMPDSGVQVRFLFRAEPCWTLVRVSDDTV